VLKSKDAMRVSFKKKNEAVRNSGPSRCIEAPRAPLERALNPGRPRRGPRESWSRSRGVVVVVASDKLQELELGAIPVVGKAVPTLHPPLRPLSHNANLRDGAQDIYNKSASICQSEIYQYIANMHRQSVISAGHGAQSTTTAHGTPKKGPGVCFGRAGPVVGLLEERPPKRNLGLRAASHCVPLLPQGVGMGMVGLCTAPAPTPPGTLAVDTTQHNTQTSKPVPHVPQKEQAPSSKLVPSSFQARLYFDH
jgi:hypothetical protein